MNKPFIPKDIEDLFGSLHKTPKNAKIPVCPRCGRNMQPASRMDEYTWKCPCIPGLVLSRG